MEDSFARPRTAAVTLSDPPLVQYHVLDGLLGVRHTNVLCLCPVSLLEGFVLLCCLPFSNLDVLGEQPW